MAEISQYVYEQVSPQSNVLVVINNELYNLTEQYARNIVDTRLLTLTKIPIFTTNANPSQTAPANYISVTTVPNQYLCEPTVPKSNLRLQLELEKQYNEYSFKMLMANEAQCLKENTRICEDVTMSCDIDPIELPLTDQQLTVHEQLKLKKIREGEDRCVTFK